MNLQFSKNELLFFTTYEHVFDGVQNMPFCYRLYMYMLTDALMNKVANALAKAACSYASPSSQFTPPNFIVDLLEEDVNFDLINNN